jgi:hypothetical protein
MNPAENNVTRKGRCPRGGSLSDGVVRDRIGGLPFTDKYHGLVVPATAWVAPQIDQQPWMKRRDARAEFPGRRQATIRPPPE